MSRIVGSDEVRREAQRLFQSPLIRDAVVRGEGKLEEPVPVHGPEGSIVGWFVAVTVGRKLPGFFQFDSEINFLRYSSFQRRPTSIEECPQADAWLDHGYILRIARQQVPQGRVLGKPYLTYDRHVTRLVWAVRMEKTGGQKATVYVAGDYAYLAAEEA